MLFITMSDKIRALVLDFVYIFVKPVVFSRITFISMLNYYHVGNSTRSPESKGPHRSQGGLSGKM